MSATSSHSRQKSCLPCAKAKRKCDQGDPICFRCASKFLLCEYKSDTSRRDGDGTAADDNRYGFMGDSDIPLGLDRGIANEARLPMLVNEEVDLLLGADTVVSGEGGSSSAGSFDDDFFGAYNKLILANPYPEVVGLMDRDRIRFCVKQLKSYPEKLFREGKTPFIHPQAYYSIIPQPLQEACCASALYLGKDSANENMIWDIIMAKATQLMEPRVSWTVSEHLACLQALIIFQIIRLFDGDIRQRADAEQYEETLTQWTNHLALRTGVTALSESVVPASWESWVFEEVICRTVIVSRMVQAMFSIQKQGYCTLVAAVTELSFSMQRAFWEAPSAIHWQKAVRDKNRFHAPRMDFTEFLSTATIEDVDELGMMMLVTYKGVDGANEWIAKTGSTALIE